MCDSMRYSEVRWRDWSESERQHEGKWVNTQVYTEKYSFLSFAFNQPLSSEITVPMATQLIAWKLLWLWVPWQHITLHYAGVKSLPASLCCGFAYAYTCQPVLMTHSHTGCYWSHGSSWPSGQQQVGPREPPPTPPWSFWFPIQTEIMLRRLIPCYTRITALLAC